jgi:hypothetical protein
MDLDGMPSLGFDDVELGESLVQDTMGWAAHSSGPLPLWRCPRSLLTLNSPGVAWLLRCNVSVDVAGWHYHHAGEPEGSKQSCMLPGCHPCLPSCPWSSRPPCRNAGCGPSRGAVQ